MSAEINGERYETFEDFFHDDSLVDPELREEIICETDLIGKLLEAGKRNEISNLMKKDN
jgi:hypothetical protein